MGTEDPASPETLIATDKMHGVSSASAVESVGLLVERCVAGEPAAWRGLHRQYHRAAMSVLRRLGVKPEHLEDCCQDVFLDVFRYLPRFRQEADFKTWLYRVCISHARVSRRRAKVASLLGGLLAQSVSESVLHPFEEGQATRAIAVALEKLSEAERVVFVLFELEGVSGKEIATILECPQATVFRRLHDARKRFVAAVDARAGLGS
jgi:RNA polymerase sigma-70 factor, ECF subfamily